MVYPVISALGSLGWDSDCEASLGDKTLFFLPLMNCVSEKELVFTEYKELLTLGSGGALL